MRQCLVISNDGLPLLSIKRDCSYRSLHSSVILVCSFVHTSSCGEDCCDKSIFDGWPVFKVSIFNDMRYCKAYMNSINALIFLVSLCTKNYGDLKIIKHFIEGDGVGENSHIMLATPTLNLKEYY